MFVGVFSEKLRENNAGDMVNFNCESLLDVRNLISFTKIFFPKVEKTKVKLTAKFLESLFKYFPGMHDGKVGA